MNHAESKPNPADVYDTRFVPALFGRWAPVVCDTARIEPGDRVVDVGCGTGALTLEAAARAGATGTVAGVDPSPDMLDVARRKTGPITWVEGSAERLPLPDRSVDAAVSQFALMFFDDRAAGLAQMRRVLRPGGRLAVAVCDAVERSAGYAALADLLDRLFGRAVGDAFRSPFSAGDPEHLRRIADEAGFPGAAVARRSAEVRLASIEALVSTERACAWTLGGILDDGQFAVLRREAEATLAPFVDRDGGVRFDMPALILTAVRS